MSEFNDRMTLQREVVKFLNSKMNLTENLYSLSDNAIDRWVVTNRLNTQDGIVHSLKEISKILLFLADKSQQPISQEYEEINSQFYIEYENFKRLLS